MSWHFSWCCCRDGGYRARSGCTGWRRNGGMHVVPWWHGIPRVGCPQPSVLRPPMSTMLGAWKGAAAAAKGGAA